MYDLRESGRNYTKLHEAIKAYGIWAKITESTWGIVTDSTATEIRDNLSSYMDSNDRLFVIKSGHNSAWKNVIASNEWFKKHLKRI
jgi:hypothetical protein